MASYPKILIVCEGKTDQDIIARTLKYADYRVDDDYMVRGGKINPAELIHNFGRRASKFKSQLDEIKQREFYENIIVVYDADIGRPSDPVSQTLQINGYWAVPASPVIESWVLSDRNVYEKVINDTIGAQAFSYEDYMSLGDPSNYDFSFRNATKNMTPLDLTTYNPLSAAVVCPSLKNFLNVMDRVCGGSKKNIEFNFSRSLLENLVLEYYPEDKKIYQTLSGGSFTGKQMAEQIRMDTAIGRKYASDLLRVCRDALARQASRYR